MVNVAHAGSRIYEHNSRSITRNDQRGWTAMKGFSKKATMGQIYKDDDELYMGAATGVAQVVMGKVSKGHPVLRSRKNQNQSNELAIIPTKHDLWGDDVVNEDTYEGAYYDKIKEAGNWTQKSLNREIQFERSVQEHQVQTPVARFSDDARRMEFLHKNTPTHLERFNRERVTRLPSKSPTTTQRKFGPVKDVPPFMPYDYKASIGDNPSSENVMSNLLNRVQTRASHHLGEVHNAEVTHRDKRQCFVPLRPRNVKVEPTIPIDPVSYKRPTKNQYDDPIWVGDIRESSLERNTWKQEVLDRDNAINRNVVVVLDTNTDRQFNNDGCIEINAGDDTAVEYMKSPGPSHVVDCGLGDTPYTPFERRGRSKISKPYRMVDVQNEFITQPLPSTVTVSKVSNPTSSRRHSSSFNHNQYRQQDQRQQQYSSKGDFLLDFARSTAPKPSLFDSPGNKGQTREEFLMKFAKGSVARHSFG